MCEFSEFSGSGTQPKKQQPFTDQQVEAQRVKRNEAQAKADVQDEIYQAMMYQNENFWEHDHWF